MNFEKLKFGEALAILQGIQKEGITISDKSFSPHVQTYLTDLQHRISSNSKEFPTTRTHEATDCSLPADKITEELFIYFFANNHHTKFCDSFYKAITSSFKTFENFCSIYTDYLNTQTKIEQQLNGEIL